MYELAQGVFTLVEKVIDGILSWPFLLVLFLVWLTLRYKKEIGSILDRRSAVPAGEINSKISREVDPLAKNMETLNDQMNMIQVQMRKVEDAVSEDRLGRANGPIKARLQSVEAKIAAIDGNLGGLFAKDEQVMRTMTPLTERFDEVLKDFESLRAKVDRAAGMEHLDALKSQIEPLVGQLGKLEAGTAGLKERLEKAVTHDALENVRNETAPLRGELDSLRGDLSTLRSDLSDRIAQVQGLVQQAATHVDLEAVRSETSPLHGELDSLKGDVSGLRAELSDRINTLESALAASENLRNELEGVRFSLDDLRNRIEPLMGDFDRVNQEVNGLRGDLGGKASADALTAVAGDIGPLNDRLQSVQQSMDELRAALTSEPWKRSLEEFANTIDPLRSEVENMSRRVEAIQSDLESVASRTYTEGLERDLAPITEEINNLKTALGSIAEKTQQGPSPELGPDLERMGEELAALKGSVERLQHKSAPSKPKKRNKP